MHRFVESFGGNGTENLILEKIGNKPPGAQRDQLSYPAWQSPVAVPQGWGSR